MKFNAITNLFIGILIVFAVVLFLDQMGMSNAAKAGNNKNTSSVIQIDGIWVYTKDKPWFNQYVIATLQKEELPNKGIFNKTNISGQLEDIVSHTKMQFGTESFNAIVLDENLNTCKVLYFSDKN